MYLCSYEALAKLMVLGLFIMFDFRNFKIALLNVQRINFFAHLDVQKLEWFLFSSFDFKN